MFKNDQSMYTKKQNEDKIGSYFTFKKHKISTKTVNDLSINTHTAVIIYKLYHYTKLQYS